MRKRAVFAGRCLARLCEAADDKVGPVAWSPERESLRAPLKLAQLVSDWFLLDCLLCTCLASFLPFFLCSFVLLPGCLPACSCFDCWRFVRRLIACVVLVYGAWTVLPLQPEGLGSPAIERLVRLIPEQVTGLSRPNVHRTKQQQLKHVPRGVKPP